MSTVVEVSRALSQGLRPDPDDLQLELELDRQTNGVPKFRYHHMVRRHINRTIQLGQVCLDGGQGFCPSVERRFVPLWSKLVEVYFIYFTLKLTLGLVLQHQHNNLLLALSRLNSSSSSSPSQPQTKQQSTEPSQLLELLASSNSILDLVGSPWRKSRQVLEVVYLFVLFMVFVAYDSPRN